jgi:hypothetical protein
MVIGTKIKNSSFVGPEKHPFLATFFRAISTSRVVCEAVKTVQLVDTQ